MFNSIDMKRAIIFLCLAIVVGCGHSNQKIPMPTDKEKQELEAIDEVITQVFEAICFTEDEGPNMHRMTELFVKEGLLINYNEEEPLILPVEQFIKHFEQMAADGIIPSLEDKELRHETRVYDRVAHRFSFYEARFKANEAPFARGVNSIQLIKTEHGWKLTSMAWNDDNREDGFFDRVMGIR